MTSKELGAISKLREEFNSIPRDSLIKGMNTRENFLESLNKLNEVEPEKKSSANWDLER